MRGRRDQVAAREGGCRGQPRERRGCEGIFGGEGARYREGGARAEGGDEGGNLVFEGTPEDLIKSKNSSTGSYLKEKL